MSKQSEIRSNSIIEKEYPISQDKINNCYVPNGETYPLCKGRLGDEECKECNLFEDMIENEE